MNQKGILLSLAPVARAKLFCSWAWFSLSRFSRWWRGAVFIFCSSGLRSARARDRAGFFFEQVRALVAQGSFLFRSNGFALRAGQR
jgi:hypothetical protein